MFNPIGINDLRQNHLDEPRPVYTAEKAPIDSSHVESGREHTLLVI